MGMANDEPFTIEILDLGRGETVVLDRVVLDRVTGATVYMEEAKRMAVKCTLGRWLLVGHLRGGKFSRDDFPLPATRRREVFNLGAEGGTFHHRPL
jgi:hypothetical protein